MTVDRLLLQPVVDPEPAESCFINTMVLGSGKITPEIVSQNLRIGRLTIRFMFQMCAVDAHVPTLLVDVEFDINVLTGKIEFVYNVHGKPPLNVFVVENKRYHPK